MTAKVFVLLGLLTGLTLNAQIALAEPRGSASGDTEPPAAVPPNGKADVHPLAFSISSFGFRIAPINLPVTETVADLSAKPEGKAMRFTLAADVLFDFDKANLRPEADAALRKLMTQLNQRGARIHMRVEGHTDGKGTDDYNDQLSRRRALSVQSWLVSNGGIPASVIATAGFGKRQPLAPNVKPDGTDDSEGRRKNRRVEIVVTPG